MFRFGRKTEEAIGLDIGTSSIKIAAIKAVGESNILTGYNIKKIPYVTNHQIDLKDYIAQTFEEIDMHPAEVNLGVSGAGVIVRSVDFPKMNREQLGNALNFEAEKYIPFNIDEVVMDFVIMGDNAEGTKMNVLLAAVKRDLVDSRVKLMERLGISINIMDVDSLASFNAFQMSNQENNAENAFFHFGYSQTEVLISVGKWPAFIRQIQIGGKDIYAAVSKELDAPPDKAEAMMAEPGMGKEKERIIKASAPVLEDIIRETQLSLGYFENRYNKSVADIYCSGGMVSNEFFMNYLSEKTGLVLKKWDPVAGVKLADHILMEDLSRVGAQLTVGVGLALRG
ncbi:MAG: type IV pilus assembly protein PilM [Candidatus Omnitrophota bacterium]